MTGFRTRFPTVTPRGRSCCPRTRSFQRCFGLSVNTPTSDRFQIGQPSQPPHRPLYPPSPAPRFRLSPAPASGQLHRPHWQSAPDTQQSSAWSETDPSPAIRAPGGVRSHQPSAASSPPGAYPLPPGATSHIPRHSQPLIIVSAGTNRDDSGAKPCVSHDKWR